MKKIIKGAIFYANLDPTVGSEQKGIRPVVIIQNDTGNKFSPTTIIAPVTTKKRCRVAYSCINKTIRQNST